MYVVKRLGRNGMWNAVSLIDEYGSFRGEAKFGTKEEADEYLAIYLKRMGNRLGPNFELTAQVKVFSEKPAKASKESTGRKKKGKKSG
jgi:hypothetical protein